MAKSNIKESHKMTIEGTLNISDNGTIAIETELNGIKELDKLLVKFNGEHIKFTIGLDEDID